MSTTKAQSHTTTDHNEIKRWAEARGASPACVKGTGSRHDVGLLRLDFPGYSGEDSLQHISWEEWFKKFDEQGLALLYQEETAGGAESNFNKIVSRETAAENESRSSNSERKSAGKAHGSHGDGAADKKKSSGKRS